jgi:hypothetical protein
MNLFSESFTGLVKLIKGSIYLPGYVYSAHMQASYET